MTNHSSIESLRSATVYGSDGEKIGKVGEVYLDDQTDQPTFATVHTGLFGTKQTFVPLDRAQTTDEGLTVPFDKDFIKGAPTIDDDGSLSPEEEQRLYEYYSMDSGTRRDDAGADRDVRTSGRHHDGTAGAGVAGTATDDRAAAAHDGHTPAEERAAERRGTAVQGG
ncbi:PRC-barrel domain-containing protein, partial [Rothia kristinae]